MKYGLLEGAMYISLWENSRGHPDNVSFMQISTKIDGFEQRDSQGFENSYNSLIWTIPINLEKFFIFTIYQNYTLDLRKHANKDAVWMHTRAQLEIMFQQVCVKTWWRA